RRTVERLPDVVEAILVLPELSRQLETIAFAAATLPEMHAEIARVRGDTARLREIDATLAEVLIPLRGAAIRIGRLSDRRVGR
ncbi:hypothetical protein, partial [Enterobacter mori]|uniref:hypothetical protein n=1 Tax=Enterobacter mori TaxID=539813 RepID=UPI0032AEFE49